MQQPSNRIYYARALARQLAVIDRAHARQLAADAARLIREIGCSPEFATRNARARACNARMHG